MDFWMWWLIIALGLTIAEVITAFLLFGMFAMGAAAAALAAYIGIGVIGQALAFVAVSVGLLIFVRPIARRHLLRTPPEIRTGVAALVGKTALVVERVDAHHGRVKLDGEIWSARTYDPTQVLEPGTAVDVLEIKGATALVYGPES